MQLVLSHIWWKGIVCLVMFQHIQSHQSMNMMMWGVFEKDCRVVTGNKVQLYYMLEKGSFDAELILQSLKEE